MSFQFTRQNSTGDKIMTIHKISSLSLKPLLFSKKNKHGASFTIRSGKTGKDYTFKISRSEFHGRWYTHIKVETQYLDFKYLGHYSHGNLWRKKQKVTTPAARAIAFVLWKVEKGEIEWLDERIDIFHTGNCLCCGRELTDSDSIERGVGPVCAKYY